MNVNHYIGSDVHKNSDSCPVVLESQRTSSVTRMKLG